jgi:hypothetical protein
MEGLATFQDVPDDTANELRLPAVKETGLIIC